MASIQFLMGTQNSKFLSQQQLPQEYRPLKQQPGIYESILNGSRLQKHKIQLNSQAEINYQKQIFVFRRMHAERLISASFFEKFLPSHFCNMSYEVTFFTEHPSYILSLDLVFPIEKAFHLLIETLQGFQILYCKFGAFSVGYNNVFFNVHHQPKVWISSDLGKTRVENYKNLQMDQQRMIIDIFRLYDQLKDERNSNISFSNYLRKLKQAELSRLNFKKVITYLIEQASKFFQRRIKQLNLNGVEKQNFLFSKNAPIVCDIKKIESKQKKCPNTISLKTKSRIMSKNPSTTGTYSHFGATFHQSGQSSFKQQYENPKKPKRHNSQQDCCNNNREIIFHKNNSRNGTDQALWIQNNRPTHYRLGEKYMKQQHKMKAFDPNTIRMFRKSLDESEKPNKKQYNFEYLTKRIKQKQQNESRQDNRRHGYNIVHTQIQKQQIVNVQQIKLPKNNELKHVLFEQVRKNSIPMNPSTSSSGNMQNKIILHQTDSNLALSNLRTLKSIINSQYSDMDSQIREDLRNMNF